MIGKAEMNPCAFTLTMLGTDTEYFPKLKEQGTKRNKQPSIKRAHTKDYYPKGEVLSVISSLIETRQGPPSRKNGYSYHANEIVVVNGPKTDGSNVGDKIGLGVAAALDAVTRGQTPINIIAHSRGAVESILIAHEMDEIQKIIGDCATLDDLLSKLAAQQQERTKDQEKVKYNTPDMTQVLRKQLPTDQTAQQAWFTALKKNIGTTSINLFAIDPVPGDIPLNFLNITWYDNRFYTLPRIIKNAEIIYYENERSDWGFTPIYPEATNKDQKISRHSMPGHHGTGSAGDDRSQQGVIVAPQGTKTTHVQKLFTFKLLEFLAKHGVKFKEDKELFKEGRALGRGWAKKIPPKGAGAPDSGKTPDPATIDVAELDFPAIYRELYDEIAANRAGYEAYNKTSFPYMGVIPNKRKILRAGHKHGLYNDVFVTNHDFVNEEHSLLIQEYFFKLFGLHENENLVELIKKSRHVSKQYIEKMDTAADRAEQDEFVVIPTKINNEVLDNTEKRNHFLKAFEALIYRVSQQYLTDDWSATEKIEEKKALYNEIGLILKLFAELAEIDNPTTKELVAALMQRSLSGISNTIKQKCTELEEISDALQTPTDEKLFQFLSSWVAQQQKDHDSVLNKKILESDDYKALAQQPIRTKIAFICQQISGINADEGLIDQLTISYEEQYGEKWEDFAKLHHSIQLFISGLEAIRLLIPAEKTALDCYEKTLRQKAEATINTAAQRFYQEKSAPALNASTTATEYCFRDLVAQTPLVKAHQALQQEIQLLTSSTSKLESHNQQLTQSLASMEAELAASHEANIKLEQEKQLLSTQLRETDTRLTSELNAAKLTAQQAEAKSAALIEIMNNPEETRYLTLINDKLLPLTKNYLAKLQASSSGPKEIKNKKIDLVNTLISCLENTQDRHAPSQRIKEFYSQLNQCALELKTHRDAPWLRYVRNTVIAAGILISGILPGLIALAIYTRMGNQKGRSSLFWQSTGANVVDELTEQKKTMPSLADESDATNQVPQNH